jgi:hypothetical protein
MALEIEGVVDWTRRTIPALDATLPGLQNLNLTKPTNLFCDNQNIKPTV